MVTQPSTNPTQQGLTSVFGGEPVFFFEGSESCLFTIKNIFRFFFFTLVIMVLLLNSYLPISRLTTLLGGENYYGAEFVWLCTVGLLLS